MLIDVIVVLCVQQLAGSIVFFNHRSRRPAGPGPGAPPSPPVDLWDSFLPTSSHTPKARRSLLTLKNGEVENAAHGGAIVTAQHTESSAVSSYARGSCERVEHRCS